MNEKVATDVIDSCDSFEYEIISATMSLAKNYCMLLEHFTLKLILKHMLKKIFGLADFRRTLKF